MGKLQSISGNTFLIALIYLKTLVREIMSNLVREIMRMAFSFS